MQGSSGKRVLPAPFSAASLFPHMSSTQQTLRDSQAIPPMLVLQSLASSHVSMVIVAGDPFTATNSKKEEKKIPKS